LVGQLDPPGVSAVEIRHAGGVVSVPTDEHGSFRAEGIARGPLSLRCSVAGIAGEADTPGQTRFVETSWLVV
ncbi:MAG: hypothetical protein ACRDZW_03260, partial [Acidimicrobiales bacterium]